MPHIHEKVDFTVGVFIVYKNTVLLRRHDKYKVWMGVGGHIELDEDPIQAAIREAKEEVGIDIILPGEKPVLSQFDGTADHYVALPSPDFVYKHDFPNGHMHINSIYFAKTTNNVIAPRAGEITEGIRWFTKEEIDDPAYEVPPMMQFLAKKALARLSA